MCAAMYKNVLLFEGRIVLGWPKRANTLLLFRVKLLFRVLLFHVLCFENIDGICYNVEIKIMWLSSCLPTN